MSAAPATGRNYGLALRGLEQKSSVMSVPTNPDMIRMETVADCLRRATTAPTIRDHIIRTDAGAYPTFMLHTQSAELWDEVYDRFPEYQIVLTQAVTGDHIGHGNMVPFRWNGTIEDLPRDAVDMIQRACSDQRLGHPHTVVGALQAVIAPKFQRSGKSALVLQSMAAVAAESGVIDLFAPIRPSHKHNYPLLELSEYAAWRHPGGTSIDPWQRLHERLGAKPAGIATAWLTVTASTQMWSDWTNLSFLRSGSYVIPQALAPIEIDLETGFGHYREDHLWMHYRLKQ
jgi:hypothetical protein